MATARSKEAICSLVEDGTLQLDTGRHYPNYTGVVISADKLMVLDYKERKLRLHSRHDGKLVAKSHQLESIPVSMCLISKTEVAVCLENSTIEILSFKSTRRIQRVNRLHVTTGFIECDAVAKVESMDKLIVSGWKSDDDDDWSYYWCVVSLTDGHVDTIHHICKRGRGYLIDRSHLAIKYNTVYISCDAGHDSPNTGVYSYSIPNPNTRKFVYHHSDLKEPMGLTVDTRGFIFVCNLSPYSNIHQLTDRGELVTIHTLSSGPDDIFYEEQDGVLYIKGWHSRSNVITRYRLEYSHQQGVPIEILNMDDRSIQLFQEALKDGKETVYSIRVMVVGHLGVGKTTLIKRLLGEEVKISERHSTEGIDIYVNCCDVSLSTSEWTRQKKNSEQDHRLQRIVRVLNEQQTVRDKVTDKDQVVILPQGETNDSSTNVTDKKQVIILPQRETTLKSHEGVDVAVEDKDIEVLYRRSPQQDLGQDISATASQLEKSPSALVQRNLTQSEPNTLPMLKLLQENADKLKQDTSKNALLTMWDFAGQYAFYTTHQTFLTRRAIYLLVSDVSEQVTDLVADECYFDSKGIMKCKVHELIEVWLNSIHSCAPSPKAGIPPVILVGTHVDKILQKQLSAKGIKLERQSILPTTSTHAAAAMKEDPGTSTFLGSQQESFEPLRKKQRVEVTPVSSITGVHALLTEDQLKKQRKSRLPSRRKQKIVETDVMAGPSEVKAVGVKIVDADVEKTNHHEILKKYFSEIRTYLKNKPTRFHLIDEDFAIDNTVVDSKLEDLKRKIVEVASQQPYWGEEIPARWILLEQELMKRKADGVKLISLKEVENINKEGAVRIEKSEELDLFLRFLHETGTIIYFSIEVLRENIVLDPVWLIDALKSLINAQPNLAQSPAGNGSQSTSPADNDADSAVKQKWSDFKEKGILTLELVDAVWTKETNPELHVNRDHILPIMEQLNIIAKPRSFNETGEKVENYFLTPCMLRQESPREVICPEEDPQIVSTLDLCCVFTDKFLPPPIFHRLLAACVAHWPIAQNKETSENLIFCGCCVFDLDLFHRLTLHYRNHVVFARITRMVIDEVKTPDVKLCTRVRKFITQNLSKIISYLGQNLRYALRVQGPSSQGVPEARMFQMWFADEGQDPDAPITHEHMNHARLCVALVTVCGKAMRDILLAYFPVPYTDIYQALLANKVNLTRKQGRPLLNQDQIQLVFPSTQGQKTGTVDQFDLSLLYTLIRNVSTVPAPLLTGWGNDPQDQPRDSSLGASVERIRSYRNHISGHSADGKINQQDFDDYWNKIDTVLHDIEAVIGGQVYSQELEKQKRQVISIFEAF